LQYCPEKSDWFTRQSWWVLRFSFKNIISMVHYLDCFRQATTKKTRPYTKELRPLSSYSPNNIFACIPFHYFMPVDSNRQILDFRIMFFPNLMVLLVSKTACDKHFGFECQSKVHAYIQPIKA
jgi:hypothetical protein